MFSYSYTCILAVQPKRAGLTDQKFNGRMTMYIPADDIWYLKRIKRKIIITYNIIKLNKIIKKHGCHLQNNLTTVFIAQVFFFR